MNKRPIFLNLLQISFPITAIVSILHRISGIVLLFLIPVLLYMLQLSLASEEKFAWLLAQYEKPVYQFVLIFICLSFIYHLIAGFRHLLMDYGWGESKRVAKVTAAVVLCLVIVLTGLYGYFLWLQ